MMLRLQSKETMMKVKQYLEKKKNIPMITYSNHTVEVLTKMLTEKYDAEVAEICVKLYKYMVERRWNVAMGKVNYHLDKYVTVSYSKMSAELGMSLTSLKATEQLLLDEGMLVKLQFKDGNGHFRNMFLAPKIKLTAEEKLVISRM